MTLNERTSLPIWRKIILYLVSFILGLIQLFLIFTLFDISLAFSNYTVRWVYLLTEFIGITTVLFVLKKPISVNYKLTWSILILILPLPFSLLYFLNALAKKSAKKRASKMFYPTKKIDNALLSELKKNDYDSYLLANVCLTDPYTGIYKGSNIKFFNDCYDKYLDMLDELNKAKQYIYLEYFIIEDGYLMDNILPILEKKGNEGVEIKILYDSVGSLRAMTKRLLKRISKIPNCKINNYEPVGFNFNILVNYRNHRKLTIIDGRICYMGGDNLADEYIHKKEKYGYWRDNCIKIEGEAVIGYLSQFIKMWQISTKEIIEKNNTLECVSVDDSYTITISDGPINNSDAAYDLFLSLINSAKEKLYISTPYFIIDDKMIDAIALKCKSGCDVRILLPHIPDKKSVFYMSRENYEKILKAGGKIYEFSKGFNHAKNIIVDKKYAFIGTINMDYRSLYLHYECGAFLIKNKEIISMENDFIDALNKSIEIDLNLWNKRPFYQRIIAYFLNIFSPLF